MNITYRVCGFQLELQKFLFRNDEGSDHLDDDDDNDDDDEIFKARIRLQPELAHKCRKA